MSKVVVARGKSSYATVKYALEEMGFGFIDKIKAAQAIVIAAGENIAAAEAVSDVIRAYSRTPIHVLGSSDEKDTVPATIPRGDDVRMPIRRPRLAMEADFVISIASLLPNTRSKTLFSIENWIFGSWIVPPRTGLRGMVRRHEPWLEGDLRNIIIADLYAQKPCHLAVIDGAEALGFGLAGYDAVAVDAVMAQCQGFDPEQMRYLSMLAMQGFGVNALSKIDVPLDFLLQ